MGKRIIALILSALLLLGLTACGDNPAKYEKEIRELQEEIDDLKAENEALKSKLTAQDCEYEDNFPASVMSRSELIEAVNAAIEADNEVLDDYVAPLYMDDVGHIRNGCDDYTFAVGSDMDGYVNEVSIDFMGKRQTLDNGMDTLLSTKYYVHYFVRALDPDYAENVIAIFDDWFASGVSTKDGRTDRYYYNFYGYNSGDYYNYTVEITAF